MKLAQSTAGVLVFYSVALTIALLVLLSGRPTGMNEADARADGALLRELASRTTLRAPGAPQPAVLVYTFADERGTAAALVRSGRPGGAWDTETHLAFTVRVESSQLFRSPDRPGVPTALLTRDDFASDLVRAGGGRRLFASLRTGEEADAAAQQLTLNNLLGSRGEASAQGADRGLAPVARRPRSRLAPEDPRTLALLARLLWPRLSAAEDSCLDGTLLLYRAPLENHYRADVGVLGEERGRLALALSVGRDGKGQPSRLRLRIVPEWSDLEVPAEVYAIVPKETGRGPSPEKPVLGWDPAASTRKEPVEVDLGTLLEGTAW